jgi:hypothetical protein
MEKGFSSEHLEASKYFSEIHQAMQDGQRGLFSFQDTKALCLAIVLKVLSEISEERPCMFDPTQSSSDPSSEVS